MIKNLSKILIICMAVILTVAPVQVLAIDKIDLEEPVSLTVVTAVPASLEETPSTLAGMELDLYKIADTNEWAEFSLTGDFEEYNVNVNGLDSEGWRDLALTLSGFADRDNIAPLATGRISESGNIDFGTLTPGLYLIDGQEFTARKTIYTPTPFIICLPNRAEGSNTWDYTVNVALKMEAREQGGSDTSISVHKVWNDEGFENMRPASVTAQLLRDGEVYDEIELNEDNNWRFTWENLDDGHQYNITEVEIAPYEVSVSAEGDCFVITNSISGSETEDEGSGDRFDESDKDEEDGKGEEGEGKLPQTGVLWWPVPVLIVIGLLFIIAGVLKSREAERES